MTHRSGLVLMAWMRLENHPEVTEHSFGKTREGKEAFLYSLRNGRGASADITNYGGIVTALRVPDRTGAPGDVVRGLGSLEAYEAGHPYFGAIVGRYANRIADGRFTLDGNVYELAKNNEPGGFPCHLHGGVRGFDKVLWEATSHLVEGVPGLTLRYTSADGEEGYPGELEVEVRYRLTSENALEIVYRATTDRKTVVNLTNHSYFNLKGEGEGDILDHVLRLNGSSITAVDRGSIPTGELLGVDGTPFDFREPERIGARIADGHEQLLFGSGYDHNWIIDKESGELGVAASVYDPITGRTLEVMTMEPGVQFYCGNFLDGSLTGKAGRSYTCRTGFCLETQHYPDSPNHPEFPSTHLSPGEVYETTTIYRFGAR